MVYVVDYRSGRTLNKADAWELHAVERMEDWAVENGFEVLSERITDFGNMVITVDIPHIR